MSTLRVASCRPCRPFTTHRPSRVACHATASASARPTYSNPIGVHAQVWVGGWSKQEIERAVKGSKESGYDLIEVNVSEPHTIDPQLTSSILKEYDLGASASLGLGKQADVSSEDGEVVKAGTQLLLNALDVAASFGSRYLVGVYYTALNKYDRPASLQSYKNSVSSIREVGRRAADLGVDLGLEVVNRYETNLLNTAAQAVEMVGEVGLSNVKVHLDTYHMNIEEDSMAKAIRACTDCLGYVHIGESHRGYLGTGCVDFQGCFEALASIGYSGPVTFESFSSEVVSPSLSNTLAVWRTLWSDSTDLACHARGFMDVGLRAAHQKARRRDTITTTQ